MGISITVSDIIEDVRLRAELPTFSTTTSIRTADVLYWVMRSAQRLSGIVSGGAGGHFITTTTATTTAGIDIVSLPLDAQALVSVYYVRDDSTEVPLDRMGPDDLGDVEQRDWDGEVPRYTIRGESLHLRPVPAGEYTLRLEYTTGMLITDSSDVVPMAFGWDEWLVLDVAIKVKQRLQQPYVELAQEREKIEAEIRRQARRDRFKGAVVRDLRPRHILTRPPYRRWPGED